MRATLQRAMVQPNPAPELIVCADRRAAPAVSINFWLRKRSFMSSMSSMSRKGNYWGKAVMARFFLESEGAAAVAAGLCPSRRGYKRQRSLHCWLLQQHEAALKTGQYAAQRA